MDNFDVRQANTAAEMTTRELVKGVTARDPREQDPRELYKLTSQKHKLEKYKEGFRSDKGQAIPTNFTLLDEILDGGLYKGLYILGAVSSLGKSTLALQMADQIAAGVKLPDSPDYKVKPHDVIYYTLEMGEDELTAKTLSRISHQLVGDLDDDNDDNKDNPDDNKDNPYGLKKGLSTREFLSKWNSLTPEQKKLFDGAIDVYDRYCEHIFIKEGADPYDQFFNQGNSDPIDANRISAAKIRRDLKLHTEIYPNSRPVVFVDYLQIMAPYSDRYSDKQNVDYNVSELRRIARDYNVPIIAISSVNRAHYTEKLSLDMLKESGGIEYTADVVLGLQFTAIERNIRMTISKKDKKGKVKDIELDNGKKAEIEKAKKLRPVTLGVLKNRLYDLHNVDYIFIKASNFFKETGEPDGGMGWPDSLEFD